MHFIDPTNGEIDLLQQQKWNIDYIIKTKKGREKHNNEEINNLQP